MRTLGIVGGIGPDSTVDYYVSIIREFQRRTGTDASPPLLIDSLDVRRGIRMLNEGALGDLTDYLAASVERLARAGAAVGLMAANTPHVVFDALEARSPIPLLSIVRATVDATRAAAARRPALLGTRFTMSGGFFQAAFAAAGLPLVVPSAVEQERIHEIYIEELLRGTFLDASREAIAGIVGAMIDRDGIDTVVLAGTELPLLLRGRDLGVPMLDTTVIHVDAAVTAILAPAVW